MVGPQEGSVQYVLHERKGRGGNEFGGDWGRQPGL